MRKYFLLSLIMICTIICLFIKYQSAFNITKENINLMLYTLLPSLLPSMLLIYLARDLGVFYLLGYLLQFISVPLFNVPGHHTTIIAGSFGGYPMPAIIANEINYDQKEKKNISTLIALFSFPSFAFFLNAIAKNLTNYSPLHLYASFFISAGIILFFKSFKKQKANYMTVKELKLILNNIYQNYNFVSSLKSSIKKAILNLSIIFGNIVIFSLILIFVNNNYLLGFFEFSRASIALSSNINNIFQFFSLIIVLLWGGVSVLLQYLTIMKKENFSLSSFLRAKIELIILVLLINYFIMLL